MSNHEHKYAVTRREEGISRSYRLSLSEMQPGDIVNIFYPQIGSVKLIDKPNGEIVGTRVNGGASQRISTAKLRPDEQGRIIDEGCPTKRGGFSSYVQGPNPGER